MLNCFPLRVFISLMFMVPTACAMFPQQCSLNVSTIKRLERELYEEMWENNKGKLPTKVYFNKGL